MLYVVGLHTGSTIAMEGPSRLVTGLTRLCEVAGDSLRVVAHLPAEDKIVERVPPDGFFSRACAGSAVRPVG